jgi:3-polyprenyl-4-hydroxybenzoate decarboxylase
VLLFLIYLKKIKSKINMRKLKLPIALFSILCLISCKKEVSEKENIELIKTSVFKKNIEKDNFNKDILPLIQELYEKDSAKYIMLNHIAKKASQEKNKEVFKMNLTNLKDELKYY